MLALSSELGARRQIAHSLNLLGAVHNVLGHYERASHYWERGLVVLQELGDRRMGGVLFNNLGVIAHLSGDYRTAFTRYSDALTIAREIGHRNDEMAYLSNVGGVRVALEEYHAAEIDLRQAIHMAGTTGSGGISDTYHYLAEACLGQMKVAEALEAAQQALVLAQEAEVQEYISAAWRALGMVATRLPESIAVGDQRGDPRQRYDAAACFAESLRISSAAGMEGERAQTLRAWARYELERGDQRRGAAMWYEARAIFTRLGVHLEVERMEDLPRPVGDPAA
jgi:tetratricopeptide (TPR) repeat protein